MSTRISIFTASGSPGIGQGVILVAAGALAGDKVLQVMALTPNTVNGSPNEDVTGAFGPFIPANGLIAQISTGFGVGGANQCIAFLSGP